MADYSIEQAQAALAVRQIQAKIAAENIATINKPGAIVQNLKFEQLMQTVSQHITSGNVDEAKHLLKNSTELKAFIGQSIQTSTNLDSEVLALSEAQGRYKAIAKVLNSKLGLMSLAVSGGNK
ncbi:hypothetical protein [Catenovulum sediminis]|uniref:hypothetical protein n=1 Tax=Catenovulum sediminis TaxID=1740262 RepID=UPI00117E7572|nr:hypothetical protein [Catenovulum sediminis]